MNRAIRRGGHRAVGSAFAQNLDNLRHGDPTAVARLASVSLDDPMSQDRGTRRSR